MALTIEEFLKMRQDRKLISAKEAAFILDYSTKNIYKLCDMGKLEGMKMFGKLYIYKDSVESFLQEEIEEL